jgi:hypothetical protein
MTRWLPVSRPVSTAVVGRSAGPVPTTPRKPSPMGGRPVRRPRELARHPVTTAPYGCERSGVICQIPSYACPSSIL